MEPQVKRLTAIEIIDETVAYYGEDPAGRRSYSDGHCRYLAENGNKCAYSRCWKEGVYKPKYEKETPMGKDVNNIEYIIPDPDEMVQEQYKGHSREFWKELQELHDWDINWGPIKGLSSYGIDKVNSMKERYKDQ